jgi:AmmeMemoRadiSam system protein A
MTPQIIDEHNRSRLTRLASDSISHGAHFGSALMVNPKEWPAELLQIRSSFVTLHLQGDLRGCIGSLQAAQPLARDVALHAFGAAFRDPRFHPVTGRELDRLEIHISVLSIPVPIQFSSESELLDLIRAGVDGLVLKEGAHRATFLPDVWQKLPDPVQFLSHLKLKAGLPANHWSENLTVERYLTESW